MKFLLLFACLGFPLAAGAADGSADAGAALFKKCTACHSADQPVNRVGPHLVGILDRPAASLPDYPRYSDAMKQEGAKGLRWTEATLAAYIAAPRKMIPKTRMTFSGIKSAKDVADIIAYLKSLKAQPQ
jgi:cytochrome c